MTFKKLENEEGGSKSTLADRKSSRFSGSLASLQEKMKIKIKAKTNKQLKELVDIFDQMY
mgnify:CR=1|jgi:hypothetical protein